MSDSETSVAPPSALSPAWDRIPQELRERRQWAVAGADKAPRTVDGAYASVTDPATWTDFDSACAAAKERGWHIGYVLSADDPFACIDFDVKDDTTQEQMRTFQTIVNDLDSYSEFSRSGKGMHVWVRGKIGAGCKRDRIELYSQERFMICTGNVYADKPIEDRQAVIVNVASQMRGTEQVTLVADESERESDDVILARAMNAANGFTFNELWAGRWQQLHPTQSEADMALLSLLTFYSPNNAQVKRLFRTSELGKRKKATKDDKYLDRTLLVLRGRDGRKRAIEHGRAIAERLVTNWLAKQQSVARQRYRLLFDKDLQEARPQRWLVKGIIPEEGIGTIYGSSGTFKSFVALDLQAHISSGTKWFGNRVRAAPCVYVPFEGRGGIPHRVAAWRLSMTRLAYPDNLLVIAPSAEVTTNMAFITEPINLRQQTDRDRLVATLQEGAWAGGVLCIDTLAQAGGGVDENSSEGMGEMIAIFQELQRRLGGVVLVVHHSGKDKSKGMRGHSSLHGALDFAIECERIDGFEAQLRLDKVKDGEGGRTFPFVMQRVCLGYDEDGDERSSLVVTQPLMDVAPEMTAPSTDAQQDADDEAFIWEWVKREVESGKYPSKNSLEGQLAEMKQQRTMTQKRVRDAIHRLKARSALVTDATKSPSNNAWLRAVDVPNTGA